MLDLKANTTARQKFALDIPSILKIGVKEWQESFYWPVDSPGVYNAILKSLDQGFRAVIARQTEQAVREVLIIRYKLLLEFSNFLYTQKLISTLRAQGDQLLCRYSQDYFAFVLEDRYPKKGFHTRPHHIPRRFSLWQRGVEVRRVVGSLLRYGLRRRFEGGTCRARNFVFQPHEYTREYVKHFVRGPVRLLGLSEIMKRPSARVPERFGAQCRAAAADAAQSVFDVARQFQISLTVAARDYVRNVCETKCLLSLKEIFVVQESLPADKPINLFLATPGRYERRVLAAALNLRNDGSCVTGFAHGEFTGHDESSHYVAINLGNVNRFGVFGLNSVPLVRHTALKYPEYVKPELDVFSVETRFFADLRRQHEMRRPPDKVRQVMLIGGAYLKLWSWVTKDLPSQPVCLDLELRVVQFLKGKGYDVVYKAHPASRGRLDFLEAVVPVVYEPFERVMGLADAYIFYRPMTTTFYEAFCTQKPVIYLHCLARDWGEDFELIQRRCRTVTTSLDDRNRLVFSEEEFREALSRPPEQPDMSFMEKFLFPQKEGGVA